MVRALLLKVISAPVTGSPRTFEIVPSTIEVVWATTGVAGRKRYRLSKRTYPQSMRPNLSRRPAIDSIELPPLQQQTATDTLQLSCARAKRVRQARAYQNVNFN